jgi:hypothetical protein
MRCGVGPVLLAMLLSGGCADHHAADLEEPYQRARSLLAQVEDAPLLLETVHTDPRVLTAIGMFLQAADAEGLTEAQMRGRFRRVLSHPPWQWVPIVDFRKAGPGRYLVALGHAVSTQSSSLYLFEGARHVWIDSGVSGTVQVESVRAEDDLIEVVYFPTPSGGAPLLKSALFPEVWYQAGPTIGIRRLGPALYLVTIESLRPDARGASLCLFAGARHACLDPDDGSSSGRP